VDKLEGGADVIGWRRQLLDGVNGGRVSYSADSDFTKYMDGQLKKLVATDGRPETV
jgi:hypothetical protein